ncbi:MAG: ribbon-helix-helix protein, CopG family [Thermoproteales archaeon]|nr:ribbon-helix-helix protein, CopG family [Thermoproteales archaeon]
MMYLKVVQTLVPEELHRKIVEIAKKEKKSIKEIVREALEEWIIWKSDVEEDTFLSFKPVDFGVETDSSKLEALIYGETRK